MEPDRERIGNIVSAVVGTFVLACIVALTMNVPQGPIEDLRGVVETAGVNARKWGAATEHVSVRLDNGEVVLAKVVASSGPAQVGGIAHVRVYRRLITRNLSYEVHQVDASR
ncbi:MAG: hypothetical protein IPP28_11460 [Xanthomonadales bacterium]|nr:hypothetical protein [Xanthomonadales bacterium]